VHRDVTRLDELLQDAGFEPNIASGFAEALAEDQNFSQQLSAAQTAKLSVVVTTHNIKTYGFSVVNARVLEKSAVKLRDF
jgi:hypothetical protein